MTFAPESTAQWTPCAIASVVPPSSAQHLAREQLRHARGDSEPKAADVPTGDRPGAVGAVPVLVAVALSGEVALRHLETLERRVVSVDARVQHCDLDAAAREGTLRRPDRLDAPGHTGGSRLGSLLDRDGLEELRRKLPGDDLLRVLLRVRDRGGSQRLEVDRHLRRLLRCGVEAEVITGRLPRRDLEDDELLFHDVPPSAAVLVAVYVKSVPIS